MPTCEKVHRSCLWNWQTAIQARCDRRSAARYPAELRESILNICRCITRRSLTVCDTIIHLQNVASQKPR